MGSPEQPPPTGASPFARSNAVGLDTALGRVIGMIFASLGGLIGLVLLVGGIALLGPSRFLALARDDDGYYTSRSRAAGEPGLCDHR